MNTIVENGLTIATVGTTTYFGLTWLMEFAVRMFSVLATIIPTIG